MQSRKIAVTACLLASLAVFGRRAECQVSFDWARVGNLGNAADTLVMDKPNGSTGVGDGTSGYGSVGYTYSIAARDVTNAQYVAFLNKVDPSGTSTTLFQTNMTDFRQSGASYPAYTGGINKNGSAALGSRYSVKTGQENFPAVHINWARAARFVNWLANGQGTGGTESGVYDMSGISANAFATPPSRAANAQFFIPSENEWYKAAYYDPSLNGGLGGYWQYGTRSNTAPVGIAPPGSANAANIGSGTAGGSGGAYPTTFASTGTAFNKDVVYLTNVGAYSTATSAYGLYDVDGLVYNWTEATRPNPNSPSQMLPVFRGGSWNYNELNSGAAYRNTTNGAGVNGQLQYWGLRVATLADTLTVVSGSQTQTQAGFSLLSGVRPVEKTGAGTVVLNQANTVVGPTTISQGTLQLARADALATSPVTVATGATLSVGPQVQAIVPSLANSGQVDVGLGRLTVTTGLTAEGVAGQIMNGIVMGGTTGITSGDAAATGGAFTVGWNDNFDGSFTFGYAAAGDTNLDNVVDLTDLLGTVGGGKYDTGAAANWAEGDFNYDGASDLTDLLSLVGGGLYDQGDYNPASLTPLLSLSAGESGIGGVAAVPEPSALGLVAAGAALLVGFFRNAIPGRMRRSSQGRSADAH